MLQINSLLNGHSLSEKQPAPAVASLRQKSPHFIQSPDTNYFNLYTLIPLQLIQQFPNLYSTTKTKTHFTPPT